MSIDDGLHKFLLRIILLGVEKMIRKILIEMALFTWGKNAAIAHPLFGQFNEAPMNVNSELTMVWAVK